MEDCVICSRYTSPVDYKFAKSTGAPTTLASITVIDANTITVSSATGFIVGSHIAIAYSARIYQAQIVSIASDVFTLDSPLDYAFPSGSIVLPFTYDMNVNGNTTSQTFVVQSSESGEAKFMITRLLFQITCDTEPDYVQFGNVATLAKGIVIRTANGYTKNLFNIKSNEDLNLLAYDLSFLDGTKHGTYGVCCRLTFAGESKHGTGILITPGDSIKVIIQDDLSGLLVFRMIAEGYTII
jgi:hypothetical protein